MYFTYNGELIMLRRGLISAWISCIFACLGFVGAAHAEQLLLQENFETAPEARGWKLGKPPEQPPSEGSWVPAAGGDVAHVLATKGYWESPAVAVKPFDYYRLNFRSRAKTQGYAGAIFLDDKGVELVADDYDSINGDPNWNDDEFYFRAHALAAKVVLRFRAIDSPVEVASVRLAHSSADDVAKWTDHLMAQMPPLTYTAPPERHTYLPKTIEALKRGRKLRIVMLGDSIANDTGNSLYEVLLRRTYPQARVEVVTSVRGGTGSTYYKDENRVQPYVLRFKPDLLIIAGISHSYDAEAMRSVIRQVRAHSDTEIMVMRDAVTPDSFMAREYVKYSGYAGMPSATALQNILSYRAKMIAMASEEKVELVDTRSAWNDYSRASPKPEDWYHRDPIHANQRGKQVVGHILVRYLAPVQ